MAPLPYDRQRYEKLSESEELEALQLVELKVLPSGESEGALSPFCVAFFLTPIVVI